MGSNTIRLIVFEVDDSAPLEYAPTIATNKKAMAGLASYVSDGVLGDDGIDRAVKILGKHVAAAKLAGVESISVFATAILRNIDNSEDALRRIEERTGLSIDLLSGEDEARLGFRGCCGSFGPEGGLAVDVGGGSTELSMLREGLLLREPDGQPRPLDLVADLSVASIPSGSLKMFMHYVSEVLPTKNEAKVIRSFMAEHAVETGILEGRSFSRVVGLGGTARSSVKLFHALFDSSESALVATRAQLEELVALPTVDFRRVLLGIVRLCPDRVHTVLVGLAMLLGIMDVAGAEALQVSKQGIREGYLLERVLKGQVG
ncbi:MAG: hypothetical protein ACOYIP_07845 [Coriobacteriales bacterium]|jgi:exopolyphosphatase/guanosine-5'-triphosphate,3'-diphosphate pyrophosphatase